MRIQYFTNDWQFIWKERATVSQQSFILNKIATLAITYSELTYSGSLPLVYPYKLFPVPSGLLGCTLSPPSVLLPSCYHLATFFLPSSYPPFCIYQKNIFHTNYYKFKTFNFQISSFNSELHQCTLRRTFPLATPLLSPCYRLASFYLPSTLHILSIYLGRILDVPWTYLGCTLPLFCIYQKNIFHTIYYKFRTFNFQISSFNSELHQYTLSRTYLLAIPLLSPCYPPT